MGLLGWAVTFLVVAIVAAIFGFGGIATAAAGIAEILFYIFLRSSSSRFWPPSSWAIACHAINA